MTITTHSVRQTHEITAQPDSTLSKRSAPPLQVGVANQPPGNDTPLDAPRANGDRALARHFAQGLRQMTGTPATDGSIMLDIPPHSTFGQWWEQLALAFKSPDVVQWMEKIKLEPSTVSVEPFTGRLYGRINGTFDVLTPGLGDHGWAGFAGPIRQAVDNLAGNNPRPIKPAAAANTQRAPFERVKAFYFEGNVSGAERVQRAEEIERNHAPWRLDDAHFGGVNELRSEQSLEVQRGVLGDIALSQNLLEKLRALDPAESFTNEYLKRTTMDIPPDSAYGRQTGVTRATLEDVIAGNGWSLPENKQQLENLTNALSIARLPDQRDGNLGGGMSWLAPLSLEEQKDVYSHVTLNNLRLPGLEPRAGSPMELRDKGALGYFTRGRHWTPAELNRPRNVLDQILESPKAQELGKALQSKMGAIETGTSAREWALTAIVLTLDNESIYAPKTHHVAGFNLAAEGNYGQPVSLIKQRLIDHLIDTGQASTEMAPVAAMILLARVAPELQIKDTPPNVTYGSLDWASLKAGVARIEALSPGASGQMSFDEVVLFDAIDPVQEEDRDIQEQAKLSAVTEWGKVNGLLSGPGPYSSEQINVTQEALAQQGEALIKADEALKAPVPTQRSVALAELKAAFGEGIPFEAKVIRSNYVNTDTHRLTPGITRHSLGTYSVLDIYLSKKTDEDTGWHTLNNQFPIADMLERIKQLPDPKEKHAEQFREYKSAIQTAYGTITQAMIGDLPLEDQTNLDGDEIKIYRLGQVSRQEIVTPNGAFTTEGAQTQADDNRSLLVKTGSDSQAVYYEFSPQKKTILRRDDLKDTFTTGIQGQWVEQPGNSILGKSYTNTSIVEVLPKDNQQAGLQAGIATADDPKSFTSARREYLGQVLSRNVSLAHKFGELEAEAKTVTTFDEEQAKQMMWREILLGVVPGLSVVRNLAKGDYTAALGDIIFDGVMYLVTAGVGKGAGAFKGTRFASARRFGQSLLKRVTPEVPLYNGFFSGKSSLRPVVPGAKTVQGARFTKPQLQEISQRVDLYEGTYKAPGSNITSRTVARFDQHTGQWFPYNPATKKPYGKPLENFKPIESTHLGIRWDSVTRKAENGPDASRFREGYLNGDPNKVPGFSSKMKSEQVRKLATNGKLSAEDIGTLVRQHERLAVQASLRGTDTFNNKVRIAGGHITPMPQLFYLSQTQPLSQGECAALSHLMAQAMKKGKAQVLIDNFYKAAANPTAASSRRFIDSLTELQRRVHTPTAFHGAANIKPQPYTAIASELSDATQSKTLMFGESGHAMTAGVVFDGDKKSFFFYEPNYGVAHFPDADSLQRGLHDIFTTNDFAYKYRTVGTDPDVLELNISTHNDNSLRNMGVDVEGLEDLYTVPL